MSIKNETLISWPIIFFVNVTNVAVVKHSVQTHWFWYCQADLCADVRVSSQFYSSAHSRVTYLPAGLFCTSPTTLRLLLRECNKELQYIY